MYELLEFISRLFTEWHFPESQIHLLVTLTAAGVSIAIAYAIYELLSKVAVKSLLKIVKFTEARWDDIVFNPKVLQSGCRLILVMILNAMVPAALDYYPGWQSFAHGFLNICGVLATMMVLVRIVSAIHALLVSDTRFKYHSLKGLFQMVQLIIIVICSIIIISILINKDPIFVLSGLGAAAAVIMLVFQDTILGLVAGVQLTANDMLRPGDWISAPKSNANGTVLEVTLTTVKVQNFDMTIVTIPPYTLVKDSFQNWRGMWDAKGRRVMRSINIDMTTVRRLSQTELDNLLAGDWATPEIIDSLGEHPVNLTLFRRYVTWLIRQVPSFKEDMTSMVRELQPTAEGMPIEIYFFTNNYEWTKYEEVQATFFDNLLAEVNRFGLRVYQRPAAYDFKNLP